MATVQYIPPSGYSPLVKTYPMPSNGMDTSNSSYNVCRPAAPAVGATMNPNGSQPTYGAGLNRPNSYPWGATNNQSNIVGNHSGVYSPVRDNSGVAGHYYNANYYDPTTSLNNNNPYGVIGMDPNVYQYRPSTQFNNGNSYSAPGSSYNINQYSTSTQASNQNHHGPIETSLGAYRSTNLNQSNNGNVYGSFSYQSQNTGTNASTQFNNGSNYASRIPNQREYDSVNNNFRKLSFRRTPGADKPDVFRKIRRTPGAGRPKAQSHEPNTQISETLPSPELGIRSPSVYHRNHAVQEPQEVPSAQEEQKKEQTPQLGEPRFHSTGIKAMNMLTRSFFDGPPTAQPNQF